MKKAMRIRQMARKLIKGNDKFDFAGECLSAIGCNQASIARITLLISKGALSLSDTLFWDDLKDFIEGVDEHKGEYRYQLSAKLVEQNDKTRLLKIIRDVKDKQQIRYITNATRCFLAGFIEKDVYFRLCHLISGTLVEDLHFLRKHICDEKQDYTYSINVQGLESVGLMYTSVINGGTFSNEVSNLDDGNRYSFTEIAYVLDMYSLSYDDVNRYPNPKRYCANLNDVKCSTRSPMRL